MCCHIHGRCLGVVLSRPTVPMGTPQQPWDKDVCQYSQCRSCKRFNTLLSREQWPDSAISRLTILLSRAIPFISVTLLNPPTNEHTNADITVMIEEFTCSTHTHTQIMNLRAWKSKQIRSGMTIIHLLECEMEIWSWFRILNGNHFSIVSGDLGRI